MSLTLARTYVSSANTTSYATTAFTPAANDLLIVFAVATGTVAVGGCTGSAGLTFTQITHAHKAAGADTLYAYVADQLTTAVSQTVTVTTTGDAASGCAITVVRVSGSGLAGIAAIRQSAVQDNRTAGGTPAPVFPALPLTTNACLGFVANGRNPATMSPPAGWTEGADIGYTNPAAGAEVCWDESGVVGTTVTWATASTTAFGAIIVELSSGSQAGIATATGTGLQASVYAVPMSIVPGLGTGTAYNVTASTTGAPVVWGEWSQTWSNPVGTAMAVFPGVAEGSGAALQPASRPSAGLATASGAAHGAIALASGIAEVATGTGTAEDVSAHVEPNAGLADVPAVAYTVTSKVSGKKDAPAGLATGTGAVQTAGTSVVVNAETVATSGGAEIPAAGIAASAGLAEGTGTATPVTAPGQAVAGLAEGIGTAYAPAAQYAQAGLAVGTGAAGDTATSGQAKAGLATASGEAYDPSVSAKAGAGLAQGTGDASGISAPNVADAELATGTGAAHGVRPGTSGGTPPYGKAHGHRPHGRGAHHKPVGTASHRKPEV